ncbi:amidohydrolase family protein [Pantoea agglomerans]|uniref:amidohydrolase family protein n=1 Tax=Enterobacter agglomerans TaxID=549 RepID=UPI002412F111|nr:amidohydrolase family protein [Pantoea agglomerans]
MKYICGKITAIALGVLMSNAALSQTILIKNIQTFITGRPAPERKAEVLHNQDIFIENGEIKQTGHHLNIASADKIIDATGKIVQPGFVDTHDHLWQVTIRGCGNQQELFAWLSDCDFVQTDITHKEGFAAVRLATYDLINTGITTVMDWNHTFSEGQAYGGLEALQQSGLRYVYGFYPHNNKNFDSNAFKIKEQVDKDPLGRFEISGHPANFLQDSMANSVQMSRIMNVPLNVHYAESAQDKKHEQKRVMTETGAFSRPLVLNHVIHVDDDDIKQMADSHARLTHNPLSNMRLASGIMPLGKLHNAGLTIGLGLDGGTNDNADFFSLMKTAVGLQRALHESPDVYPNYSEVLLMATSEGAKVLGLEGITGTLEKGKSADLIIINPQSPNMAVNFDEVTQIPLNAEPANVETVMVHGRILKEDGKLIYTDQSLKDLIDTNSRTVHRFMSRKTVKQVQELKGFKSVP